ncbi:serine hydrolase domain-containing protein [Helicovermis profundi]|uniref:serine hydrolase domain-containing protein n=1 Tax=Helicovermis profundi TaxID=3065157 RepID=UPI003BB1F433
MNMKIKKLIIILILVISTGISMFFIPWSILSYWMAPLQDDIQNEIEYAADNGFDGVIVYVDRAGEVETYASGWQNRENEIPANPETLFKIASISKLYIAAATTKLIDADMLSVDDTLSSLLPELVGRIEYADKITLKMMLQHRSGIPNFVDDPDFSWDYIPTTNETALELVLDEAADFEPDNKYSYSNTNYLLIGDILDKTLGYSHHEFINNEILKPLGLKNTYNLLTDVPIENVMSGYSVGYEWDVKYNDFANSAGSMVATIEDVGIFIRALNDGSLFTDDEQALYTSLYTYDHTGLLPGYQSIAKYHKDIDTVVIQFNNTSGGKMWNKAEILYNNILKIIKR